MTEITPTTSEVDLDHDRHADEPDPDPFREVMEMEAEANRGQLETLSGNNAEGIGRTSANGTSQSTNQLSVPDTSGESAGKRPGIDTVLTDVESQIGAGHADVIRGVLTGFHRTQAEWKNQQTELNSSLEEVNDLIDELQTQRAERSQPAPDPNDPINQVTPEQWALFNRMLASQGIPTREELSQQQTIDSQRGFIQDDISQGIEQFGDDFGHINEEGKFIYSEEVQDATQAEFDRLYDPERGPTARDLFFLARRDELLKEAEQKGYDAGVGEATNGQSARTRNAMRATVERNSASGGEMAPRVYDAERDKTQSGAIDFDKVIARASAAALRKMPVLPT